MCISFLHSFDNNGGPLQLLNSKSTYYYVNGFEKSVSTQNIHNIQKYQFNNIKYCILGSKTDTCMQFTTILLAIHSLSMHQLLNEQQTKLPTILDSFYWHSYYHKHFYTQVWRVRVVGNHEVSRKGYVNTKNR